MYFVKKKLIMEYLNTVIKYQERFRVINRVFVFFFVKKIHGATKHEARWPAVQNTALLTTSFGMQYTHMHMSQLSIQPDLEHPCFVSNHAWNLFYPHREYKDCNKYCPIPEALTGLCFDRVILTFGVFSRIKWGLILTLNI